MTGDGIGLSEIVFVLGLLGFALWKTGWIRILFSTCIVIWGVFAVPYDVKIASPLLAVGTVLFIMEILKLRRSRREGGE